MSELVVIFGAGASFAAPNQKPINQIPPLTRDLFSKDYLESQHFMIDIKLISPLFKTQDKPFEDFLKEVYENLVNGKTPISNKDTILDSLIQTIYYLQDLFYRLSAFYYPEKNVLTSYNALVSELFKVYETMTFITFNYDTLLESTLKSIGFNFSSMDSFVDQSYKIIKPHGSCNWAYAHTEIPQKNDSFDTIIKKLENLRGEYVEINNTSTYANQSPLYSLLPCMAIPINIENGCLMKKFVCPEDHVDIMKTELKNAKKILIIGWAGNEDHFGLVLNECCFSNEIQMLVIGNGNAHNTIDNISCNFSKIRSIPYDKGFKESLKDGTIKNFLINRVVFS